MADFCRRSRTCEILEIRCLWLNTTRRPYAEPIISSIWAGAGVHGGQIVAEGSIQSILKSKVSETAAYLSRSQKIGFKKTTRQLDGKALVIRGATGNNLRGVDARFPLGQFICVTGVSGSGKSSLISGTLKRQYLKNYTARLSHPYPTKASRGSSISTKSLLLTRVPLVASPLESGNLYSSVWSYPGTFCGVPEGQNARLQSRALFFQCQRAVAAKRVRAMVCAASKYFLPDVFVTCEVCSGRRYNRETLEVLFKGKSIADVLEMTVQEAVSFFQNVPTIHRKLLTLEACGFGLYAFGPERDDAKRRRGPAY